MNLIFRLLYTLFISKRRSHIGLLDICSTPFRVYFTDLDPLMHMNNGKYFSLQDLARVDMMIRNKSMPIFNRNNWYPVVVAETLQFKKSLELFDRFQITTQIIGWDEKSFILEHRFQRKNEIVASGFVRARFLKKSGGSVLPNEIIQAAGFTTERPQLPQAAATWLKSLD